MTSKTNTSKSTPQWRRYRLIAYIFLFGVVISVLSYFSFDRQAAEINHSIVSVSILVLGVLSSILISAYLCSAQRRTEKAQRQVRQKIRELSRTNNELIANRERTSAVVNNISDSIITINQQGIIQSANLATADIFGYEEEDLIGKSIALLMPEPMAAGTDGYLKNFLDSGFSSSTGTHRKLRGLRCDGSIFPLEIQLTHINFHGEKLFLGTLRDNTEQHEAERLKNEFISTVSHELRTPLTAISGALGMVSSGMFGELPPKVFTMIELAVRNSARLSDLVNDLLDIEKVQSGGLEFKFEQVDVSALIKKSLEVNRVLARTQGVVCEFSGGDEALFAHADPHRLTQVIACLLSNAFKFSPRGETVEISLQGLEAMVRICIADKGPGIEEKHRAKIFEKFIQIDASDTRQQGGTGLGLSLAKAFVGRHNGIIGYEINRHGGATFFVEIPRDECAQTSVEKIDIDSVTKALVSAPAKVMQVEGDGVEIPNILFVEDDLEIVQLVSIHLANVVKITSVTSVAEAQKTLDKASFSLVILDSGLPDGSVLDLLGKIKTAREIPTPVVVFSRTRMSEEISQKVDVTMVKSKASTEELADSIKRLLKLAA